MHLIILTSPFHQSRFNQRQSDFTSLLAYNDYLEEVETLTFNLIHNIDVAATEATLAAHAAQNATSISRNAVLLGQETAFTEAQLAAQKEGVRLRRAAAREEEDEEKREREEGRREIVEKLAHSNGDADQIIREGQTVVLKKSTARRTAAEKARQARPDDLFGAVVSNSGGGNENGSAGSGFTIRGLKPVVEAEPEKPYDPFGGISMQRDYYQLQDHYDHPWLDQARTDPQITAGGYDLKEYYARTMLEAFAGLGCFIAEEMAAKEAASDPVGGTAAATEGM